VLINDRSFLLSPPSMPSEVSVFSRPSPPSHCPVCLSSVCFYRFRLCSPFMPSICPKACFSSATIGFAAPQSALLSASRAISSRGMLARFNSSRPALPPVYLSASRLAIRERAPSLPSSPALFDICPVPRFASSLRRSPCLCRYSDALRSALFIAIIAILIHLSRVSTRFFPFSHHLGGLLSDVASATSRIAFTLSPSIASRRSSLSLILRDCLSALDKHVLSLLACEMSRTFYASLATARINVASRCSSACCVERT